MARVEAAFETNSAPRVRRVFDAPFRQGQDAPSALLLHTAERLLTTFSRAEDAVFIVEHLPGPSGALAARVAARAQLLCGELDAADELMARWAQSQDRLAAALLRQLASARVRRGELAQAQQSLELARRVLPQDRATILELASLHLARGLPGPAVSLLQSRLQLATHDDATRRRLAFAYHAAGRADDAIAELLRLGEARDLCAASRVALEHGDVPRAVSLARRGVAASVQGAPESGAPEQGDADAGPSDEALAQRALGFALARAGDRVAAIRALQRALFLDPSSVEARTRLGELGGSPESES